MNHRKLSGEVKLQRIRSSDRARQRALSQFILSTLNAARDLDALLDRDMQNDANLVLSRQHIEHLILDQLFDLTGVDIPSILASPNGGAT